MLDLGRDLQSDTTQDLSTPASHLQVRTLPERVAVQEVRQDGVQDLIRHVGLNKENRAAGFESESLVYVELETGERFLWVNLRFYVLIAGMN